MLDLPRRALAAGMLLLALTGLLPLLPRVLGFHSATVTNHTAGTYYPTTAGDSADVPFIKCWQSPEPNGIRASRTFTGNYFKCNNNWGTAVTITWSTVAGGSATGITVSGSTLSIPAGAQNQCVLVTLTATAAPAAGTVRVQGSIDQSDLNAVIQLGTYFAVNNIFNPPPTCF